MHQLMIFQAYVVEAFCICKSCLEDRLLYLGRINNEVDTKELHELYLNYVKRRNYLIPSNTGKPIETAYIQLIRCRRILFEGPRLRE